MINDILVWWQSAFTYCQPIPSRDKIQKWMYLPTMIECVSQPDISSCHHFEWQHMSHLANCSDLQKNSSWLRQLLTCFFKNITALKTIWLGFQLWTDLYTDNQLFFQDTDDRPNTKSWRSAWAFHRTEQSEILMLRCWVDCRTLVRAGRHLKYSWAHLSLKEFGLGVSCLCRAELKPDG